MLGDESSFVRSAKKSIVRGQYFDVEQLGREDTISGTLLKVLRASFWMRFVPRSKGMVDFILKPTDCSLHLRRLGMPCEKLKCSDLDMYHDCWMQGYIVGHYTDSALPCIIYFVAWKRLDRSITNWIVAMLQLRQIEI